MTEVLPEPGERYPVPRGIHRVEQVVRRSRFITTVGRARTADEAHAFVDRIREEFPDATHHCWAFVAGPPGATRSVGMSDAGEPRGTAGRPMLTVLLHSGIGEIVAVSSRWFGGTELGTGGLARAYSGGVEQALENLSTQERIRRVSVYVTVGYAAVDGLRRLLEELEAVVEDEEYGAEVRYRCAVPESRLEDVRRGVADLTRGEGRVETSAG